MGGSSWCPEAPCHPDTQPRLCRNLSTPQGISQGCWRGREHPQGWFVLGCPFSQHPCRSFSGFAAGESRCPEPPPELRLHSKMSVKPSGGGGKNPKQQLDAARGCSSRLRTEMPPRRGGLAWRGQLLPPARDFPAARVRGERSFGSDGAVRRERSAS